MSRSTRERRADARETREDKPRTLTLRIWRGCRWLRGWLGAVLLAVPPVILPTRRDRASLGQGTRRDEGAKNYTTCLECQVAGVVYGGLATVDAKASRSSLCIWLSLSLSFTFQPVNGLATLSNTLLNRIRSRRFESYSLYSIFCRVSSVNF